MTHRFPALILAALIMTVTLPAAEPWTAAELLPPAQLAQRLTAGEKPLVIFVGPQYLYRAKHIAGSLDGGMAASRKASRRCWRW